MKIVYTFIGFLFAFTSYGQHQDYFVQQLNLIDSAIILKNPNELVLHLEKLPEEETVIMISFSKKTGNLERHEVLEQTEIIKLLESHYFDHRFFMVLIDSTAIFHIEE